MENVWHANLDWYENKNLVAPKEFNGYLRMVHAANNDKNASHSFERMCLPLRPRLPCVWALK